MQSGIPSASVSTGVSCGSNGSVPQAASCSSVMPSLSVSLSHTSPMPSASVSFWSVLGVVGQLSIESKMVSLSSSGSALSPMPSPSLSEHSLGI